MNRSRSKAELNSRISHFQIDVRHNFEQLLRSSQDLAQGKSLISPFSANWKLLLKDVSNTSDDTVFNQAIEYPSSCSCTMSRKCLEPARIYSYTVTLLHTIDSVMRGCVLLESLMASPLSYFFSSSCINALFQAMSLESSDAGSDNV